MTKRARRANTARGREALAPAPAPEPVNNDECEEACEMLRRFADDVSDESIEVVIDSDESFARRLDDLTAQIRGL